MKVMNNEEVKYRYGKGIHKISSWLRTGETITLNDPNLDLLFQIYKKNGLGAKGREYIAPFIENIKDSYRMLSTGNQILLEVSLINQLAGERATVTFCKSTNRGYMCQMMINDDLEGNRFTNPTNTMKLNLFALSLIRGFAYQCGFKESTAYSSRLFGMKTCDKVTKAMGVKLCDTIRYEYMMVPKRFNGIKKSNLIVELVNQHNQQELTHFVTKWRGEVLVASEGLDDEDFALRQLNEEYRQLGSFRSRNAFLVYRSMNDLPVAAAITYRGPIRNFRCLGNLTYLIIDPTVKRSIMIDATELVMNEVGKLYSDFPLSWIPVLTTGVERNILECLGSKFDTSYSIFNTTSDERLQQYWKDLFINKLNKVERRQFAKTA